jgi:hypothetical protein
VGFASIPDDRSDSQLVNLACVAHVQSDSDFGSATLGNAAS